MLLSMLSNALYTVLVFPPTTESEILQLSSQGSVFTDNTD